MTPTDFIVRAGTSYIDRSGVEKRVKRIITHEKYDHIDQDYDIGLVELVNPLRFSQSIQPIALPSANAVIPDNITCLVSGKVVFR